MASGMIFVARKRLATFHDLLGENKPCTNVYVVENMVVEDKMEIV